MELVSLYLNMSSWIERLYNYWKLLQLVSNLIWSSYWLHIFSPPAQDTCTITYLLFVFSRLNYDFRYTTGSYGLQGGKRWRPQVRVQIRMLLKTCAKIVQQNEFNPKIDPCEVSQDSVGFWISIWGFLIPRGRTSRLCVNSHPFFLRTLHNCCRHRHSKAVSWALFYKTLLLRPLFHDHS